MFECLTRLFGEGKVRVEIIAVDKKCYSIKIPFIGCFDSEIELIREIANMILLEKNIKIIKIRIVAIEGRGSDAVITGNWFDLK
jgi:hypothetical protein